MKCPENKHMKGDQVIWMVVIILSLLSLLAVYSSTGTLAYKYQEGNTLYYMMKHLIILALDLCSCTSHTWSNTPITRGYSRSPFI